MSFMVAFNNKGIVYKSMNNGFIKKVIEYIVVDGRSGLIHSNDWNVEINSEEELREFANKNEELFN